MIAPASLERVVALLERQADLSRYAMEMKVLAAWSAEIGKARNADPKRLIRHGYKVYSQNDEDGIIAEIFRRIGIAHRTFVEFGVESGIECNTVKLLIEGWRGLWIEANPQSADLIRANFDPFLAEDKLMLVESHITAENVDMLIRRGGMHTEVDLLSIDIDCNDYWVWKAISAIDPRVVTIEYNATLRPPMSLVVPYRPDASWDGSNFYGASLEALVRLATAKGYRTVGCSVAGVNAFFVRADLCGSRFLEPATAEEHYEPPRHYFHWLPAGHRPRPGPYIAV
jgi:hypothetical protein